MEQCLPTLCVRISFYVYIREDIILWSEENMQEICLKIILEEI